MLNENAKLLVSTLRSDRFKQGSGLLKSVLFGETFHCCLGVVCELAIEAGVEIKVTEVGNSHGTQFAFDGNYTALVDKPREWIGFTDNSGSFRINNILSSLIIKNDASCGPDKTRLTFPQIADLIESEPEGLFAK